MHVEIFLTLMNLTALVFEFCKQKWKDFKVVLKRKYFDSNLYMRQNISNGCGNRAPTPQWEGLVKHWKSNERHVDFGVMLVYLLLKLNCC